MLCDAEEGRFLCVKGIREGVFGEGVIKTGN